MMKKILLMVVVGFVVSLQSAVANDTNPPLWRGQEGTTYARWEFMDASLNPSPEPDWNNEYGPYDNTVIFPAGGTWAAGVEPHLGSWMFNNDGYMDIGIFNRDEPLAYKDIWVQLTWGHLAEGGPPTVEEIFVGGSTMATLVEQIDLDFPWHHSTYLIHLEPNPNYEVVRIAGGLYLDEVVIDTICIPEPATIVLVGLGGLLLRRRKSNA